MQSSRGFVVFGIIIGVIIGFAAVIAIFWEKNTERPRELTAIETITPDTAKPAYIGDARSLVELPGIDAEYVMPTVVINVPPRFSNEEIHRILGTIGHAARGGTNL